MPFGSVTGAGGSSEQRLGLLRGVDGSRIKLNRRERQATAGLRTSDVKASFPRAVKVASFTQAIDGEEVVHLSVCRRLRYSAALYRTACSD